VNQPNRTSAQTTGTPFWASMGDYYIETSPSKYNEPVGVNTYANSVGTFEQNSDGSSGATM